MSAAVNFDSILQPKAVFTLWNPRPQALEFTCGGETFVIPGRDEDRGYGKGRLNLYDKPAGSPFTHPHALTAREILVYAVGEDGRSGRVGVNGIRVLFHDEGLDIHVQEEAIQAAREADYQNDLAIQYAHQKTVQTAKDAGEPTPTPDKRVRQAMERVAAYQAENGNNAPFKCDTCAWPFYSQDAKNAHVVSSHSGTPVQQEATAVNSDLTATVAALIAQNQQLMEMVKAAQPRKPGRPKKEDAA